MEGAFEIDVTGSARAFLLRKGTSDEYGARELKRIILRHVTQPLAAMVSAGTILAGDLVHIEASKDGDRMTLKVEE
jgi:ATP-dependent Clp protease ATP-binding subunit ClpA